MRFLRTIAIVGGMVAFSVGLSLGICYLVFEASSTFQTALACTAGLLVLTALVYAVED